MKIDNAKNDAEPLSLEEYTDILMEIDQQPLWRSKADKEMDYEAGNQLDSDLLAKLRQVGIPPAVENIIAPAINAVRGLEAKTRTDWRVTPDGDVTGQEVADALNHKLNQAERHSKADRACSGAFHHQYAIGLGWVEVSRDKDPFRYPYRCSQINRNEIWWDTKATEPDLTDGHWLRRQRWMALKRAMQAFPASKDLFAQSDGRWFGTWSMADGGMSTNLSDSWSSARGQTIEEQRWWNPTTREVCVNEIWYRRWVNVAILKSPNGRVVEYDADNQAHNVAIATGAATVERATVARVRQSFWLGPHLLHDGPSPYTHRYFGYVPFWGWREDRTGIPYGAIRHMIFPQDSLNSAIAKLRWGMSAMRTERTKGAVAMKDEQFRQMIARPDADVVLNAEHMAQPGARFDVKRDYQLTEQHYQLMNDARASVDRASGITASFMGRTGTATSGLQEQTQMEQSTQSLAAVMDNFRQARTIVGEILMSFLIEDMGERPDEVMIEGDAVREDRRILINQPAVDDDTGQKYLHNDVQRTMLKVAMEDVPTTSSFRVQQLNAMSEAVKSMPANLQAAAMPFMLSLMDVPFKRDVVEAIRAASEQESPESVDQRIKQAVQDALVKSGHDIKARELELRYTPERMQAEVNKIVAETVESGLRAAFAAMQGGQVVASMPQVAPVADELMRNAGWRPPNPAGADPNIPQPVVPVAAPPINMASGDTSPQTPAEPASPAIGQNRGINTMREDSTTMQGA